MTIVILNIVIYIIFATLLSITDFNSKTIRNVSIFIGGLMLLSLYLLKNPLIFPDIDIYEYFFNDILDSDGNIKHDSFKSIFEEGWVLLTYLCRCISGNFILLVFVVALCITTAITQTAREYSAIAWMSIVLFLCVKFEPTLYILRQTIALSCFLFSLKHINDRKFIPFICWIIIGYLFHRSILICIPIYFLTNIKLNTKNICITLLFSVIGLFGINTILGFLTQYFFKLEEYTGESLPISFLTWVLPIITFTYCWLCFKVNSIRIQGINHILFWMALLEIILVTYSYIGTSFDAFYRLNFYFAIGKIYLIPNATSLIKDVSLRSVAVTCLCTCWILYLTTTMPYGYEYINM